MEKSIVTGVIIASNLLVAGCATGPKYTYSAQEDSAYLEGPVTPMQGPEDGSCAIDVARVDGYAANFDASLPGNTSFIHGSTRRLYLAPGLHELSLDISEVDIVIGNNSDSSGIVGGFAAHTRPSVKMEFAARHIYRFTARLANAKTINLILWDETNGRTTRTSVGSWTFDSNGNYSQNP